MFVVSSPDCCYGDAANAEIAVTMYVFSAGCLHGPTQTMLHFVVRAALSRISV